MSGKRTFHYFFNTFAWHTSHMKRWKRYILIFGGGIGFILAVLTIVAIITLNSKAFRQQMVKQTTILLTDKLKTKVSVKDADIDFKHAQITLQGVEIEDRQKRKMLQINQLGVQTRLWPLLFNEIRINDARISGLHAHFYKPSTKEPANYQFVIDALKKDRPHKGKKLVLNIQKLFVENNSINYNDNHFSLKRLYYRKGRTGWLEQLNTTVVETTPKGQRTHLLRIDSIGFSDIIFTKRQLNISGIHYTTDRIKAEASMEMDFNYLDIDSLNAMITKLQITELNSGYKLSEMRLTAQGNKKSADIKNLSFRIEGNKGFEQGVLSLRDAHLEKGKSIDGHNLKAEWTTKKRKGEASHQAIIEDIHVNPFDDGMLLTMQGVSYGRKTHTPRKNKTGIPDLGNLRVEGDMQIALKRPAPGTSEATMTRCKLTERFSGMRINDMQMTVRQTANSTQLDGLKMMVENPLTKVNGSLQLSKAQYQKDEQGTIEDLQAEWHVTNANGYESHFQAEIGKVHILEQDKSYRLNLDGLHYATVNIQPGKEKTHLKGYPSLRRLDMTAHLQAVLNKNTQEDIVLTVTEGQAYDRISGLNVQNLRLKALSNKERTQISQFSTNWSTQDAKGKTDNHFSIAGLNIKNLSNQKQITVKGFRFANNNHQPRKATKGKMPAPDAGHLNITGNLKMLLNHYSKDTLNILVTQLDAFDKESGMNIDISRLSAKSNKKKAALDGIQGHLTWGAMDANFSLDLKSEKNDNVIEVNKLKVQLHNRVTGIHTDCSLHRLILNKDLTGKADDLLVKWNSFTKKGMVDNLFSINSLNMKQQDADKLLTISGLRYATDNHRPRKNIGKPKRGFFDINHLDLHSDMTIKIKEIGKEGVKAALTRCGIKDKATGINVVYLLLDADIRKDMADIRNIRLRLPNSELKSHFAHFQFADKQKGIPFHFETGKVEGEVLLQDISHTFAPILKNFTLPLEISTRVSGTSDDMAFENVTVNTTDQQLKIWATGKIVDMKDKYGMIVRFDVDSMYALGNSKMKVINQFPVKKLMMDQVDALGDIGYKGHFRILWKKEEFHGRLSSAVGPIDFDFTLDEKKKNITGNFITDSIKFGKAFDVKTVNYMACKGDFQVDYAKVRTAAMRTMRNGKLPIGVAKVDVIDAHYRFLHFKNLHANLSSDGAVANGRFELNAKYIDWIGKFAFVRTSTEKRLRFRPGIRFHKRQKTYEIQRRQLDKQIQEINTPISYVYLNRYEIPMLFQK